MAVSQPLKGNYNKVYSVMANFNGGIDRQTADDLASDSTFKELINFCNENEGNLSKRPGVYNSYFTDFINALADIEGYKNWGFYIRNNAFDEDAETVISKLKDFRDTVLFKKTKTVKHVVDGDEEEFDLNIDKIIGVHTIENDGFLEVIQNYKNLLQGGWKDVLPYDPSAANEKTSFTCIIVASGNNDLYLTRFHIDIEHRGNSMESPANLVQIEVDYVDSITQLDTDEYGDKVHSWQYDESVTNNNTTPVDMVSYNGYTYIPTGKDYIIRVDHVMEGKDDLVSKPEIFQIIGGKEDKNLYAPTPLELTQIGFNILATNPLSFVDEGDGTSRVNKIRGIFYTIWKDAEQMEGEQPISQIPYNKPFNIHVIHTGDAEYPDKIEYRHNSGELDETKNPYTELPGTWMKINGATMFKCSGLDEVRPLELRITLGEDKFIAYATTGVVTEELEEKTGGIDEIKKLIFSSTHLKVIGTQLVLYGGHGYVFFSEYGVFNYFPNYFFIYVSNEAGEEYVTSINYFRQYYAIFTNKRIKKMVGTFGASDFGVYPLNDFIGCINGSTVRAVGNNLYFLGNDGIYKLKQGYLGEGTENVEKIDSILADKLNPNTVTQALVFNNNYIIVKNDGSTWIVYDVESNAFYEYNLESIADYKYSYGKLRKDVSFPNIFEANVYDNNGNFLIVPMYTDDKIDFMTFRFIDVDYIALENKHKDGYGFISTLETHNLNMGYPTNTKKFKDIYIKTINKSGQLIPLYVTIYVDDRLIISPEDYIIKYDEYTNTYYYVKTLESNAEIDTSRVLGEFTLGDDILGEKTVQQLKFRVGESGRSIRIILSDGYDDLSVLDKDGNGTPIRIRNIYDFAVASIGISYKVKKVKEG